MLLPPPTPPASPVIKATTANRAHRLKRNGRKSSCFVRTKAGEMDSTAEARFGTQHLPGKRLYGSLACIRNNGLENIVQWKGSGNNHLVASAKKVSFSSSGTLFSLLLLRIVRPAIPSRPAREVRTAPHMPRHRP